MTYENFLSITSSYYGYSSNYNLQIRTANVKTDGFMTTTGWTIFAKSGNKEEFNLAYAGFKVIWRTTG